MTAQYLCLASNYVKFLEWANSWTTLSTVGVQWWSLWIALLRSWGSKQMHNWPDAFQAYAIDETQSGSSSTRVMTPSFTILSNSVLTLGCMEIGHFWGACVTGWALSHSLMVYSPGELAYVLEPIWELSDEVLCRLDWNCFLGCWWSWEWDHTGGKCLGWPWQHSSCWQLLISHMMGAPRWQDQGCLPYTNRSLSGRVGHWGSQAARW